MRKEKLFLCRRWDIVSSYLTMEHLTNKSVPGEVAAQKEEAHLGAGGRCSSRRSMRSSQSRACRLLHHAWRSPARHRQDDVGPSRCRPRPSSSSSSMGFHPLPSPRGWRESMGRSCCSPPPVESYSRASSSCRVSRPSSSC